MMFDRRSLIGSIALLLAETRGQAQPQSTANSGDWPVRSVRFIVPAAAGSAGDDISRLIAAKLSERFGQQFFIVNQPAAVGTLAMQDLVRAIPDGYTIGQISVSTQVIAKLYNPSLPYDGIKDFALISLCLAARPTCLRSTLVCQARTLPNSWRWLKRSGNR
jgi:tripartite-type tricarboxylate transporter receptor subunit TctC